MNVLLTGGAGYIGSHVALCLFKSGYKPVILDNFSSSNEIILERLETLFGVKPSVVKGDVRDENLIREILIKFKISAVIHLAGSKSINESLSKPLKYYNNNIVGILNLLRIMSACNIKKLVFSSSAAVYGEPNYCPIDESHPAQGDSPYAKSKLYSEEILKDICKSDADWSVLCLRYFNPLGADNSGLIGEFPHPDYPANNLMPNISRVAKGLQENLKIFGVNFPTKDGTAIRDFIHVMDLAEGHVSALRFLEANKNIGCSAINLGTGSGYSVLEVLDTFSEVIGRKVPYEFAPRREGDVAISFADSAKAHDVLGWAAKRSLRDICKSAWIWECNKPPS
jgi:UDP-glucose 4-epimerase